MHWIFNKILRRHFNLNLDCVVDRVTTIQLVTAVLIAVNLLLLASFVFSRGINTEIQKNTTKTISPNWIFNKISLFRQKKKYLHLKNLPNLSIFLPAIRRCVRRRVIARLWRRKADVGDQTNPNDIELNQTGQSGQSGPTQDIDWSSRKGIYPYILSIYSFTHSLIHPIIHWLF